MKTPEKYLKEAFGDYRRETIAKVYEEYQKTLKQNILKIKTLLIRFQNELLHLS